MEKETMQSAILQVRRMGTLMNEFLDVSTQLAQSLDRNDAVSTRISLAMRQEALDSMQRAKQALVRQMELLPSRSDKERLQILLNGGEPDAAAEEQALAERVAANVRLHKRIIELDRVISRKIARDCSVYARL